MAKWGNVIFLLDVIDQTDADGFKVPVEGAERRVYANEKSVGYSEFYKAQQAGMSAELKLDIRTADVGAETHVRFNGKLYKILRTYKSKNGEFTELTLTDLSTKAGL